MKKILNVFIFMNIISMSFTSLILPQEINSPKEVKFKDNRQQKDKKIFNDDAVNSILENITNTHLISQKNISDSLITDAVNTNFFNGAAAGDQFGISVCGAGDVNGDGYDDIIIGSPFNDSAGTDAGKAFIYYGSASVNSVVDVVLSGEAPNNNFGTSVSTAGDVNGDGFADVIIGAQGFNGNTGRAYVYYGGANMNNIPDNTLTGEATGNHFGNSVSSAGNVNGDGYSDIVVGAKSYNSLTGRAYIFYGGFNMDNSADVVMTGVAASNNFGNSVSTGGDINADGFADVIVGVSGFTANTGRAYIFKGGTNMDNIPDITLTGEGTNNYFGCSVSTAGDVNGDGYADVITGAYGYSTNTGRAYIFLGGTNMNNSADVTMTGEQSNNYFGHLVSKICEINGDGYSEVIVGAYSCNSNTGKVYIFYGGVNMNNVADIKLNGETVNNNFGSSVGDAGDVNGDGYCDVLIGAPGFNNSTGKAYLYIYGMTGTLLADLSMVGEANFSNLGFSVASAGDVNADGYSDILVGAYVYNQTFTGRAYLYYGGANMDNIADLIFDGEDVNNYFGYSVASAGDVNNDGYSDIIIGAYGYFTNVGRAFIYKGGAAMNNIADYTLTGFGQFANFGISVSSAGDVNNDGYSDVLIGSNSINSGRGRAYLYFGGVNINTPNLIFIGEPSTGYFGTSVSSAGDVNNDGYSDLIVGASGYSSNTGRAYLFYGGSNMDTTKDLIMTGAASNNYFGFSVSKAGDVNKDGFSDIIVGAYGNNVSTGKAYIYFGGTNMNNASDISITGEAANDQFGRCVANAGDINADGYADVLIGAEGYSSFRGRSYVFFGGANMNTSGDVIITGDVANIFFGKSVSAAGDVNGDGINDIIAGANNFSIQKGKWFLYMNSTPYVIPNLVSVKDVPNDQGGFVNLKFTRSAYDNSVNGIVTNYLIERSIPPGVNGYQWVTTATVPATQSPIYNIIASTPTDSGAAGNNTYFFRITALTALPNQFWVSNIVSGYSVKNILSGLISLKVIMEGFYNNQTNNMRLSDTAKIYLRNSLSPYSNIDSSEAVIDANSFTGLFQIMHALSGNYYIVVKHRNTIETWSNTPLSYISNTTVNFDFTTSASQAFGNNMKQVDTGPIRFAIYSGDVNQDGTVDLTDGSMIDNHSRNFVSGYVPTDLNGDATVDISDATIADNNQFKFVSVRKP
ncbi:MAG: FG-GAP-like repeat-containing protein [Bacteroidota bacterium]|nr:FG-GAP-like repeat-containing protein [Bacteroidota bacterium]